jgi:hypothetical protein
MERPALSHPISVIISVVPAMRGNQRAFTSCATTPPITATLGQLRDVLGAVKSTQWSTRRSTPAGALPSREK